MKTLDLFIFVDALGWKQVQERDFLADLHALAANIEQQQQLGVDTEERRAG